MLQENKLYNENCIDYLSRLDNNSVDLFILDPPYYNVVNEKWDTQWKSFEEYHTWCLEWLKEIERTSKKSASLYLFGFPYQLTRLLTDIEDIGYKFRQQIIVDKGIQSVAGRVGPNIKLFPTVTESIFFFAYDSIDYIRKILNDQKAKRNLTSKEINEYLGKASNGGGTWSSIAGMKQKTPSQPTKEDWQKLNKLFDNELEPYDDLVFRFNSSMGLTNVWNDIC
jgi:DNA modification methylase